MTDTLLFAMAQLNSTVGDVMGNARKLLDARKTAMAQDADIIIAPELYLSGYQLDDLVQVEGFLDHAEDAIQSLAAATKDNGPAIIVGAPRRDDKGLIRNSVFVLDGGEVVGIRDKARLPRTGVFDDPRNFIPGEMPGPVMVRGVRLGLPVCEDMWHADLVECIEESGAEMLISCNGSPFEEGKIDDRMMAAVARVSETRMPLIYVNLVGGQDDQVFDGASFAVNPGGRIAAYLPCFSESVTLVQARRGSDGWWLEGPVHKPDEGDLSVWRCLVLGIRDYVEKNRFERVILGLSGGVDSALVAVLAVDALGAGRVDAVMMPSHYTSQVSLDDAAELAANLGIRLDHIDINPAMVAVDTMLEGPFAEGDASLARENLQSRLRGLALMSISNTTGQLLLSTGNKSEYATGYATLYGDMCGGYAPLIDVWKTRVFELCRFRNSLQPRGVLGPEGIVIPNRIITRPPSAELRPDQKDSDSLPDYETLDAIMKGLVEKQISVERLIEQGFDADDVRRSARMLMRAEYKRRQAAPGPKVTRRAFTRDRRFPITNRYPLAGEGR
ncbi:MAG: NAD+ synthase [Alphaproteobacteria bacterium]|nr:NAD+ synthase [Alphaproteobacteria bacterium]